MLIQQFSLHKWLSASSILSPSNHPQLRSILNDGEGLIGEHVPELIPRASGMFSVSVDSSQTDNRSATIADFER